MCGILGAIPKVEENIFKLSLDTLIHRGPDDYGIEHIGNEISLGHRRLAIVDLSIRAHQPMSDKANRYSIVFNGEIYNFIEIKKELTTLGHSFVSSSDTEVLLNAYIQWGSGCTSRLNGMWAFTVWDKQKKELFLSRDRFGKKPLFYSEVNKKFIFASEMKAIFPFLNQVRESKDFHWMKENIFLYEGTDKCLIDGIKRFPAGYNGVYKNGKLTLTRYWNTLDNLVEVPISYEEQVEKFRDIFMDACKIRMRSDVPIGTALSGGLDSSATISAMAHLAQGQVDYGKKDWQHAFVASFPGTPLDETPYAKMVVDDIGIDATYVNINPLEYWDNLDEYLYQFEELYITSPIPMLMTYGAVKKGGVSVTIDGHGADELFSGYGHLLEALWDSGINLSSIKDVLNTHQETIKTFSQGSQTSNIKLYTNFMLKKSLKKLLGRGYKSIDFKHRNFKNLDNFSQELYVIFHETILPTLLRNYDRYSMMNSVEIRMPFMDHRLVSYVNSLPYSSKFGGGYTKKLIRDAMDPFMPKEVTWRKSKIGFNSPIVNWMQNELRDWFGDTVNSQGFLESSLLTDPKLLKLKIENIINKKESNFSNAQKSWSDLTPYLWEKAVLKRSYRYE
ncbi:MAG: asparagine synthase (glutamine-hydrolyzing) [SAR324 cluster bacterium]|uniref:asparagine synthase (glutamine-hydrolyzing) n=1 Tax=SAR324 cluster bacterium TaxID=2024889 RepID=A0A2A4T4L8_9DELT|nr:MAG: asparagine synthase (glutamine-hydrolyzing) [SAR324 cluster bacterium]